VQEHNDGESELENASGSSSALFQRQMMEHLHQTTGFQQQTAQLLQQQLVQDQEVLGATRANTRVLEKVLKVLQAQTGGTAPGATANLKEVRDCC
jgi:hypothetical protein